MDEILPSTAVLDRREQDASRYRAARQAWEQDPKYTGRSLARHLVEDVHEHFRKSFRQVLAMVDDRRAEGKSVLVSAEIVNALRWRLRGLLNHHNGEDQHFFPTIRQRFPEAVPEVDILERDHQRLHPLEDVVLGSDGTHPSDEIRLAALYEFNAFLNDHLNREEMLVVPLMLANSNRGDWW